MAKAEKVTVKVPQPDGEIVISVATVKTRYTVIDHCVEVDSSDLARFCKSVDGAEIAPEIEGRDTPGESNPDSPESKDGPNGNRTRHRAS